MTNDIRRVAVIGSGTMGHGIAQVAASVGCTTTLFDVDSEALARAMKQVRANLDKGVSLGKVEPADRDRTLDNLMSNTDLAGAVGDSDLVIEAVPEIPSLKAQVFSDVQDAAPHDVILASNTSSLSIGNLSDGLARPDRFIGLHFFNPVHIMRLVEVVWGPETSDDTRDSCISFVRRLGKEPIVVKDSPGFASSRLGIVLGLEAMRMVEEGVAEPEAIDTAMELGYRHPMGPLRLTDLVGLDVRLGIAEYLHGTLQSDAFRPPAILKRLVAEGKLGKKSGHGFYDWSEQ